MKILVVKLSSLGDLFHALPCVHDLKLGLNAEIHWLVQSEYADLVRCFTDVDRVLCFRRRAFFRTLPAFWRELRAERYDVALDLQGLLKSALATRLARAGRRIGPSFSREGARLLYTAAAGRADRARHAVDQILDVVDFLGVPRAAPAFPLRFPRRELAGGRPRIALCPQSRWATKNWPRNNFVAVARRLLAGLPAATVYLLGGAEDREAAEAIARAVGARAVNLAGTASLVETGSLLQEMDLLISNDSGPVHLAAALGVPVLVIFGPTDPRRTGPYGDGHRVLQTSLNCQPCLSRTCSVGGLPCMHQITVDDVERNAREMLAAPRQASARQPQVAG